MFESSFVFYTHDNDDIALNGRFLSSQELHVKGCIGYVEYWACRAGPILQIHHTNVASHIEKGKGVSNQGLHSYPEP